MDKKETLKKSSSLNVNIFGNIAKKRYNLSDFKISSFWWKLSKFWPKHRENKSFYEKNLIFLKVISKDSPHIWSIEIMWVMDKERFFKFKKKIVLLVEMLLLNELWPKTAYFIVITIKSCFKAKETLFSQNVDVFENMGKIRSDEENEI